MTEEPRIVYRIVLTSPPTSWDFTSNAAKGLPLRNPTPEKARWWAGISVYDVKHIARSVARHRPRLGEFIAALRLSETEPITVERTGSRPGHYTLWGSPTSLLACVVAVVAV